MQVAVVVQAFSSALDLVALELKDVRLANFLTRARSVVEQALQYRCPRRCLRRLQRRRQHRRPRRRNQRAQSPGRRLILAAFRDQATDRIRSAGGRTGQGEHQGGARGRQANRSSREGVREEPTQEGCAVGGAAGRKEGGAPARVVA